MWSLLTILCPVSIYALNCSTYSCHPPGFDYGNVCYTEHNGDAYMQLCRETGLTYCDVDFGTTLPSNCTAPPTAVVSPQNPGASCASNSQCISNVCTNALCQGNSTNAACSSHSDCGVGLYCASNSTCQAQIAVGGNCYVDYECVNSAGCDKPTYTAGKCVAYYSVGVKSQVQYCVAESTEAVSRLCSTGVCSLTTPNVNGLGNCTDLAANVNYGAPCNSDTDCVAKVGTSTSTITGDCQCGFSASGNAYCNAFSGDQPSVTVLNLYKAHISNTTALSTCHTLDRFAAGCAAKTLNSTQYSSLVKNSLLTEDLPNYMDNDYCTQLNINEEYYQETLSELSCPSWSCATANISQCLIYDEGSNSVFLNTCGATGLQMYGIDTLNTSYCDTSNFNTYMYANVSCEAPPAVTGLYPGNKCTANSNCLSGNCTNTVCQGAVQNAACTQTSDCNSGLRCNANKVCSSLLEAGASGCYNDYDCSLSSACNKASGTPGKCVQYLSLKEGEAVSCFHSNGFTNICETGACKITDQTANVGVCTKAPKLATKFPKICTADSDCVGKNSAGEVFTSECSCGYNMYGHSYCDAFPGDEPWLIFLDIYKYISVTNSVDICHSADRYSATCLDALQSKSNYNSKDSASVLHYNATSYYSFLDNDQCVKSTVNSYYWSENPVPPNPIDPDDDDDDFACELAASAILMATLA
mmetsp:Transcript_15591/g.28348  ORF Transcript_15591/g.28348 Transcript_15591/m.28348 type:complete len:697 (+) Transcript_15591:1267-3357(+)